MNPVFVKGGMIIYCLLVAVLTVGFSFYAWPQLFEHAYSNWHKQDMGTEIAFGLLFLYGAGGYLCLGGWHICRVLKKGFNRDAG